MSVSWKYSDKRKIQQLNWTTLNRTAVLFRQYDRHFVLNGKIQISQVLLHEAAGYETSEVFLLTRAEENTEFDPRHHELNNIFAAERGQIYKKFTKQEELDPQDMTRYMAHYWYIEEIYSDNKRVFPQIHDGMWEEWLWDVNVAPYERTSMQETFMNHLKVI